MHSGKVTHYRTLDFENSKIETTISGNVTLKNDINAYDNLTYWSIPQLDGTYYSEGNGTLIGKGGDELASWRAVGKGHYSDSGQTKINIGSAIFRTKPSGVMAFLNNTIGLYEYEIDNKGNTAGKMWQWK